MITLPWQNKSDVELGTNEFVDQFTLNRNLDRLHENDQYMIDLLDMGVATELASDAEATSGVVTAKAITANQLHFADIEYTSISGHSVTTTVSDSQQIAGIYQTTYTINGFLGDNVDVDNIRGLYIKCFAFSNTSNHTYITATFPDDTTETIFEHTGANGDDDGACGSTIFIPINKNQTDIIIRLVLTADTGTPISSYTIIGASQRTFES